MDTEVRYGGSPREREAGATTTKVHMAQGSVQTDSTEETPRCVMRGTGFADRQ